MPASFPAVRCATLSAQADDFSLTRSFSWVWKRVEAQNRFNGLLHTVETVETVATAYGPSFTQLKQGVNERPPVEVHEISGLTL